MEKRTTRKKRTLFFNYETFSASEVRVVDNLVAWTRAGKRERRASWV